MVACFSMASKTHALNWTPMPPEVTENLSAGGCLLLLGNFNEASVVFTTAQFDSIESAPLNPPPAVGTEEICIPFDTPGRYYLTAVTGDGIVVPRVPRPDLARITVVVARACSFPNGRLAVMDIDGDGGVFATTDGLLLKRYAAGVRGDALVANAIGINASRCSAYDVEVYLQTRVVP
ncbi:MAG: hypothetical protein ACRDAM_10775 [Casimicrobium sp.]